MGHNASMISLDVRLHPLAADPVSAGTVRLAGADYMAVLPTEADRQRTFDVSFEEAAERLDGLARLHFEPDGSFVWVGDGWQLDGVMYDRNGRVAHIELKGQVPSAGFERLLAAFGCSAANVLFELKLPGVFLGAKEFRRFAQS
jgi:hypothetical protein